MLRENLQTANSLALNPAYVYHHTSARRGYVSRKCPGVVQSYTGRFGSGFVVLRPRLDTTRYIFMDYFIAETEDT